MDALVLVLRTLYVAKSHGEKRRITVIHELPKRKLTFKK